MTRGVQLRVEGFADRSNDRHPEGRGSWASVARMKVAADNATLSARDRAWSAEPSCPSKGRKTVISRRIKNGSVEPRKWALRFYGFVEPHQGLVEIPLTFRFRVRQDEKCSCESARNLFEFLFLR